MYFPWREQVHQENGQDNPCKPYISLSHQIQQLINYIATRNTQKEAVVTSRCYSKKTGVGRSSIDRKNFLERARGRESLTFILSLSHWRKTIELAILRAAKDRQVRKTMATKVLTEAGTWRVRAT